MQLARVYFDQRLFEDMKTVLLRSLKIYPTLLAYRSLGNIMMDKGDLASALNYFERVNDFLRSPEEKLQDEFILCYAYARAGEQLKAKNRLLQILNEKPDFEPALQLLANVNKQIESRQRPTIK
jgi:tetratricopeptide (TPR) repeat protein